MASDTVTNIRSLLTMASTMDDVSVVHGLVGAALTLLNDLEPSPGHAMIERVIADVTPTVQSDGYEFEVAEESPEPACTHQHQSLVGNELRCAKCGVLLQVTGVVGKTVSRQDAAWAQAAIEGAPDGPNREGT